MGLDHRQNENHKLSLCPALSYVYWLYSPIIPSCTAGQVSVTQISSLLYLTLILYK